MISDNTQFIEQVWTRVKAHSTFGEIIKIVKKKIKFYLHTLTVLVALAT